MSRRFEDATHGPVVERTHVQDGPRPERSDHSNLGPQERSPHPTARVRALRSSRQKRSPAHARPR